jgi:hypothetical protein
MLKKITIKIFILSIFLLLGGTEISAQTRIRFARGKNSATVSGRLPYNYYKIYVVRARAGQSIIAKVTSENGQVCIAENYEYEYFLDLMEDGDYTIEIMNLGPETSYKLTVTIINTPR